MLELIKRGDFMKLSKQAKILLSVGIIYTIGHMIAGTFINVFLFNMTSDYSVIIIINLINYITTYLAFVFGSKYVIKGSIINLFRAGIISTALYYLFILILKEKTALFYYSIPLGMFNGAGIGLFYFAFNNLVSKLTTDENRGNFFGTQSYISTTAGIVLPTISGLLISWLNAQTGYYVLFAISTITFGIGVVFTMMLNKVEFTEHYRIAQALKLRGNTSWDAEKMHAFLMCFKEALYGAVLAVFSVTIMGSEGNVGPLNSIMSIIGVLTGAYMARMVTLKLQKKYFLIFSVIYFIATYLGAGIISPVTLVIMYVLLGIAGTGDRILYSSVEYRLFAAAAKKDLNEGDFIVAAELHMALGRVVAMVGYYALTFFFEPFMLARIVFFIIPLTGLLDYFVIKRKVNWFSDDQI